MVLRSRNVDRSRVGCDIVHELRRPGPDHIANDPFAGRDRIGQDRIGKLPEGEDRLEGHAVGLGQVEGGRVRREERLDPFADLAQYDLNVERRRDLLPDVGKGGHLVATPVRLAVEPGVLDRDADIRGNRRQEARVGLAEPAFLGGALDADRADRHVAHDDRHAEVGLRQRARPAGPERLPVSRAIEEERLARADDQRRQALAEDHRVLGSARPGLVVVREFDPVAFEIVKRDIDDVGLECPPHLLADELDQVVEIELAGEGLADLVDRRQLGQPLARLVDEADVLEGDAQARGKGGQQLDVRFAEGILAVDVLERDHAPRLVPYHERCPQRRPRCLARHDQDLAE